MVDGIYYAKAAAYIGAAITMGFGILGPAIGQGMIGMKGCESMAKNAEGATRLRNAMLLAMALIETCAIYCLLIAGILIYVGSSLQ